MAEFFAIVGVLASSPFVVLIGALAVGAPGVAHHFDRSAR